MTQHTDTVQPERVLVGSYMSPAAARLIDGVAAGMHVKRAWLVRSALRDFLSRVEGLELDLTPLD